MQSQMTTKLNDIQEDVNSIEEVGEPAKQEEMPV
jgi:hypothetical protein